GRPRVRHRGRHAAHSLPPLQLPGLRAGRAHDAPALAPHGTMSGRGSCRGRARDGHSSRRRRCTTGAPPQSPTRGRIPMTGNPDPPTIVVASASDRRSALPLAVMLNSAGAQAAPGVRIEAYVLDDGVPDADKRRVAASLAGNVHLTWRRPVSVLE